MKCPICTNIDLLMSDRNGIEIDYCPQCRGVWLDRGELDKIIEKSLPSANNEMVSKHHVQPTQNDRSHYSGKEDHHESSGYYTNGKKRKKESFLGDLFDF